jgi:hypothetical protein
LPSVVDFIAAAALAASELAVGDPEIAALASSAGNPWMCHQTSVQCHDKEQKSDY